MLKKFLIGTLVAFALLVTTTAFAADFGTTTLRVGSKGEAVKAVQTLVGATADGSFGPMTKAKVMAWQAANSLTADGVFGPMSKAKAMAGSTVVTSSGCPAGALFNSLTGAACTTVTTATPGCAAGALFSATTGAACTTGTTVATGTTDGSLTASSSSFVSSGVQLKKGETKDVAAVRLQATVGPVKVSRVDVEFNVRPWLFFNTVALHDNTGKVIATKTLSSIADTTELTVGSLYMVRFDGLNYTVAPGTNPDLAVSASVLSATDKIGVNNQQVIVGITSMRTISEVGYVDTITYANMSTLAGTNTVTLLATGSVATLYSRLSPSSPLAGQQVVSTTATTNGVTLGVFSLKTSNNTATVNTLPVTLISGTKADFSNFRLVVGGTDVAGGVLSGSTVTFSNLTTPLALDTWTDFAIKADIAQNATATSVATSFDAANMTVTDANYGSATLTPGLRTSSTLSLTTNAVTLSAATATLGSAIVQNQSTVGYNATYAFTLTNSSNNDLYVSATPATFLGMSTTGTGTPANALTNLTVSTPSTAAGDSAGVSYVIPSGTSRTFTFAATLRDTSSASTTFAANAINYYTTATMTGGTAGSIQTGLTALTLTASF